ncbi:DUF1003 domain-containing protein [Sphingosinicella sp.]|jgi:uncharacterized membrane protein|uniref:DUF1003 domain-containing protein n=1 Tax=Sphingosinicella sp. TaxID=1917971 RepID=UPI0018346767|nr:DUF1003 domain-containing protein [Sphingosinicella sp.]MBA4759511.1 DUF1003 domain-containing protein [Sphingosinicella sp.]MEA3540135.1 DUF1003 domain-containing protein [Pseudomonadota bacterium]
MRPIIDIAEVSKRLLGSAPDELGHHEKRVLEHVSTRTPISRDAGLLAEEGATVGERLSDRVAEVGGSWGFIIAFAFVLLGWMLLNSGILKGLAFDPYPFIFLNLMLSTLAAVQAPIIMMSQNRQADKDRLAARLDYEVNLRAELEILRLHEKLDLAVIETLHRLEAEVAALKAQR